MTIGAHLATRSDAIALLGLGSVGAELDRLDEHSDLDFVIIVDEGAERFDVDPVIGAAIDERVRR